MEGAGGANGGATREHWAKSAQRGKDYYERQSLIVLFEDCKAIYLFNKCFFHTLVILFGGGGIALGPSHKKRQSFASRSIGLSPTLADPLLNLHESRWVSKFTP